MKDEAHHVAALNRFVFRRLADPAIDVKVAIDVAAETLQRAALEGIGARALGEVTQACLLELTEGRSPTLVLGALAQRVRVRFRLLHDRLLREVLERITLFKAAKRVASPFQ